jgi:uncharacterized RDD family membrane protein YckC
MPEEREPRVLGGTPEDERDEVVESAAASAPRSGSAEAAPVAELEGDPTERQKSLEEALDDALDEADGAPVAAKPRATPASEPAIEVPAKRPAPLGKRTNAPTFHVAGFWRRLAAAAIDLAIILPVSYLLCWIAGSLAGIHLPQSRHRGLDFWLDLFLDSDPALVGAFGLTLAIGAIYAMVFQVTAARTPGMRVLKTRIIDLYGDPPSTGRALARTAGYLAGVATLALGFLWIGFDSEKRGLHDWVSGTYVVKV